MDLAGPEPGRVRDFTNLSFEEIAPQLEDKPGRDDPSLATGDIGIRSGYWYLEGDERAHEDGRFRTLMVKGVEIRTPPVPDIERAIQSMLSIEWQLTAALAKAGLGLAIAGFNPVRDRYDFDPPLNTWERAERAGDRGYDGSHVSTLSYGPDINLSWPGWNAARCLDAARKLNAYAPYIVPFSFSSPFFAGRVWEGLSRRTYARAAHRPAVKVYLDPETFAPAEACGLAHPARLSGEVGRIEFKAFDALISVELLRACCHLLEGICLASDLAMRSEGTDIGLYRRAALSGFADSGIREGAREILAKATQALRTAEKSPAVAALAELEEQMTRESTPAHRLLERYGRTGSMVWLGGLGKESI
ncbi:glutamate-cysteine ligase family protein [Imhoffiella purpurea]|uniref:glutamate-cysteine ligase family protein n=1 Tax=Imhoffiella purpurea TaxID=1249627 RepID=UPI0018E0471C|nr:glutamate-cysteine ligase family protein [Imhoffiella purpurea]